MLWAASPLCKITIVGECCYDGRSNEIDERRTEGSNAPSVSATDINTPDSVTPTKNESTDLEIPEVNLPETNTADPLPAERKEPEAPAVKIPTPPHSYRNRVRVFKSPPTKAVVGKEYA